MYIITTHALQRLKGRGIVPFSLTRKEISKYIESQLSQPFHEHIGEYRLITKNNAILVIKENKVVTGYWNRGQCQSFHG